MAIADAPLAAPAASVQDSSVAMPLAGMPDTDHRDSRRSRTLVPLFGANVICVLVSCVRGAHQPSN